jgi:hypothetical protein
LSISGTATLEKVADVANVEPEMALKIVAPKTVPRANPPGMCPRKLLAVLYIVSAIPELDAA